MIPDSLRDMTTVWMTGDRRVNDHTDSIYPGRSVSAWSMAIVGILFCSARIPFLGHILSLDEAWILSALKSIAGGQPTFTEQFWRHPPLYLLLGLTLSPLKAAFEYRLEFLTMVITLASLVILIKFTARYFGNRIALYTGIVFSLSPGPIFFDTWIKRDCLVSFFGLLATWALLEKRDRRAGLFLGLAFLSKETAFFFGLAIPFLLLLRDHPGNIWRRLLTIYGLAAAISGGWYLLGFRYFATHWDFFLGKAPDSPLFTMDWWYYFARLQQDLGGVGLLFLALGLSALLGKLSRNPGRRAGVSLIPLSLLLPAYAILTLSHGKPPWMTISLYPFLAMVCGVGIAATAKAARRLRLRAAAAAVISPVTVTLLLALPNLGTGYPERLETMCPDTREPIRNAYIMADSLNSLATGGETVLLFPDPYRGGSLAIDPIMTWLLEKELLFINDLLPTDYDAFISLISSQHISWVIIYPGGDRFQKKLLEKTQDEFGATGYSMRGGILLKVDGIWNKNNLVPMSPPDSPL